MRPSLLTFLLTQATAAGDSAGEVWKGGTLGASPFPWVPLFLLLGPAVIAAVLIAWYVRTARQLRRVQLAPPAWLVPYLQAPPAGTEPGAPAPVDPDDALTDEARLESTTVLARRKRALLAGLALNFIAGWAGAGVYLYASNRGAEFEELPPSAAATSIDTLGFAGLEEPLPVPPPPPPTAGPPVTPPVAEDTAAQRLRLERQAALARRQDSLARERQRDSLLAVAERVRDSVARAVRDSVVRAQTAVAPAPPPPAPAPAPPPPAAPPPPDPEVERAQAVAAIRGVADALVRGVNSRSGLEELLAPGDGRDRFLRFVREQTPTATLGPVAEPTMATASASGLITVQFQWRGPFGDTRRRTGRFQAEASRGAGGWRITSLTSLDNLP